MRRVLHAHLVDYPTPVNLNYSWNWGALAGLAHVMSALLGGISLSALVRSELYESANRYDTVSFASDPLYNGLIAAHAIFQIFFM